MGASMVRRISEFLRSDRPTLLVTKYALFAGLSIASNLGSQWVAGALYGGPLRIYLMLVVGTSVGLIVKYLLDKSFIFFYQTETVAHDLRTFLLYVSMGVVTTAIFWGTELAFDALFSGDSAKYIGGFIGLTIGYTSKFFLDRKWVFTG